MKKLFKYLSFVFTGLLCVLALVSCGEDSKKLSDEEIQANFNDEISKGVTKNDINTLIGESISSIDKNDLLSKINSIQVPNTKATLTAYGKGEAAGETATILEGYVWQKDSKIYVDSDQSDCYYLDLNELKELIGQSTSSTTGENVDYVGTILSALSINVDVDTVLALLKFNGSDFTYSDGYFTLKEDAIVNKIATYTKDTNSASALYKSVVSSLTIKLGYDGYHFNGLVVEFLPGAALAEYVNVAKSYVKLDVKLEYAGDDVSKVSASVDLLVTSTDNQFISVVLKVESSETSVSIEATVSLEMTEFGKYSASLKLEATTKGLVVDASISGYAATSTSDETGKVTYSYSTTKLSASLNLTITETTISGSATYNGVKALELNGTISNSCIKSLTATLDGSVVPSMADELEKIVLEVTTDSVSIPADVVADVETARNILNFAS